MFHRRTRSGSISRPSTPASTTAHSAAAQAFLASRNNANLSAAAAAAALRTMSTTPTQVSQVQTRRTLQRQNSNSSNGSARGRGPGLQRQGSSGSMTERTFRSPSPHGNGNSGRKGETAPPVPPLPRDVVDPPPLPVKSHRRAISMEPPPPRVLSPPLKKSAGRGASLDRAPGPVPQKPPGGRVSGLQNINELERTDSQQSINFSYPRGARPMSPTTRSPTSPETAYQNTASPPQNVSSAATEGMQTDGARAAQPVKKKKKKVVANSDVDNQPRNTVPRKSTVTPAEPAPVNTTPAAATTPTSQPVKKKKKVVSTGEASSVERNVVSPSPGSDSDSTPEKVQKRAQRASGTLNKQPSVVREDWEGEQDGGQRGAANAQQRAEQGLSPVSSPSTTVQGKKPSTAANSARKIDETSTSFNPLSSSVYASITTAPPPMQQPATNKHLSVANNESQSPRNSSLSPSRSMRFSDRLSSDMTTGKKHEPLPRSVSPAKSALKHHSPSPSATSPTDAQFSPRLRSTSQTPSEVSDITSTVSADGTHRRKKSARVSFDEDPEVVGTAAAVEQGDTPILASPQSKDPAKKGWFGGWKNKAPALGTIPAEDDLEEVMKPRPDLPSFGSVRSRNRSEEPVHTNGTSFSREIPTREVAPAKHVAPETSATSSEVSASSNNQTLDTSISSDHAIGGFLAQTPMEGPRSVAEPAAEPARSSDLPLPPEVTTVEGSGDASDSEGSIYSQDEHEAASPSSAVHELVVPPSTEPRPTLQSKEAVPSIAVQPATPGVEKRDSLSGDQWLVRLPGGFPNSAEQVPQINKPQSYQPEAQPAELATPSEPTQPKPQDVPAATPVTPESSTAVPLSRALLEQHLKEKDESDTSDGDSVYSDAEEDVPHDETETGFGSINAIVESPVVSSPPNRVITPPDSPAARNFNRDAIRPDDTAHPSSWDQAQAHWSGVAEAYRQGIQPQSPVQAPTSPPTQGLEDSMYAPKERMPSQGTSSPRPQSALLSSGVYQDSPPPRKVRPNAPQIPTGPTGPPSSPKSSGISPDSPRPRRVRQNAPQIPAGPTGPPPRRTSQQQALSGRGSPPPQSPSYASFQSGRGSPPLPSPPMKKSMRSQSDLESAQYLRGSLRTPPPVNRPAQPPLRQSDYNTAQAPKPKGALQKKKIPPTAAAAPRADENARPSSSATPRPVSRQAQAPVQRTFSNDSDSESSFRKHHRKTASGASGSYNMRRSMRAAPVPEPGAGRGGVRSLSPVMRRPFSPAAGGKPMRSSMRTSAGGPAPSLRPQPGDKRSSSLFARSKRPSDMPAVARAPPSSSRMRSRFADSDDEDDGPRAFRSRFEDSEEDEPEPVRFRPVRGIPRKIDEGDSTDLDDSSDGERRVEKPSAKRNASQTAGSGQPPAVTTLHNGSTTTAEPMSPATAKKRGLWSRLGRRKPKDENSKSRLGGTIGERNATLQRTKPNVEAAKAHDMITAPKKKEAKDKSKPSQLGFKSIAERDAVIERTRLQLEEARDRPGSPSSPSTPKRHPVPQREGPQRIMSDSWPLPPKMPTVDDARPNTSDGVRPVALVETVSETNLMRPDLGVRNNTSSTVRTIGGTPVYSKRTGRKKKFPMLRRAFGLED